MRKIHLIANAHLDPVWQWNWREGCGEVLMTFRSALDRLDEYPELIFTCSSAAYYRWVEELDPKMFGEICSRVAEGRWVPVNGWWVQPDCNMPSGESFARHSLYSQSYYREKFGRLCRTGYNIDSFGHSGSLPRILKESGMSAYVYMRPKDFEGPAPNNAFLWEGNDGTTVPAFHLATEYGLNGSDVIDSELKKACNFSRETDCDVMFFFGVGNHGGGPTRGDIEHLLSLAKDDERLVFSDPDSFFKAIESEKDRLPRFTGELQHNARGCYSSASPIKRLNRKGENALVSAEKWDTLAYLTLGTPTAKEALDEAWKDVLFCQFHDSICGCSIGQVYEDAKEFIGHSLSVAHKAENAAHIRLISAIDTYVEGISAPVDASKLPREFRNHSCPYGVERPIVVFNPHPYTATWPVQTYHPALSVRDSKGNFVPFQNVNGPSSTKEINQDTCFLATVPPMGYQVYWLKAGWNGPTEGAAEKFATDLTVNGTALENSFIKAVINPDTGLIDSLVSKPSGDELLSGPGAVPVVIDDSLGGSWGGKSARFDTVLSDMKCSRVRVTESGPFRATVRASFVYGLSTLTVDYVLTAEAKALRMSCKAVWHENATVLKLTFPLAKNAPTNTAEVAFSVNTRESDGGEEYMHRWVDAGGLSVINDCRYGYDCNGRELRITALRNTRYCYGVPTNDRLEDDYGHTDQGQNEFELYLFPHGQESAPAETVRIAELVNAPLLSSISGYHKGALPQSKSFFSLESESGTAALSAMKTALDGSGDTVIRIYESLGVKTWAKLTFGDREIRTELAPFDVLTFRISREGGVSRVDFTEV